MSVVCDAPQLPNKFRIKKKIDTTCYNGVLYPIAFAPVPVEHDGKPVIDDAKHYIHAQMAGFEAMFADARHYGGERNTRTLCQSEREPAADYIETWQQFGPTTAPMVRTAEGNIISREQWLFNAVRRARPAELTPEQKHQLEHAAYWKRFGDHSQREAAANVISYYAAAGHTTIIKRPYNKRAK